MQTASTETRPPRATLAWRYFRQIAAVSAGLVLAAGLLEAWFGYRESRLAVARLQGLQAKAAAAEIEQFLAGLQRSVQQVQALPWGQPSFGPAERREELHRLLSLNPALTDLVDLDAEARQRLAVSRIEPDHVDAGLGAAEPTEMPGLGYGLPSFDATGAPYVPLVLARSGIPAGRTVAKVHLGFLADVLSGLRVAEGGEVYLVDGGGKLIAHADPTQVLKRRQTDQDGGVVAAAKAAPRKGAEPLLAALDAPGLNGSPAITTALALEEPGWLLFVEHPRARALEPLLATLQRTLLLVALACAVALAMSATFARRMAAPLARLRSATASITTSGLPQTVELRTGDEIEDLADDFNAMARRLQRSYAELEDKVAERTLELAERRDQAERANAAKTRFLASASHDLRQPMHAIGLMVGMLRERHADPASRRMADRTHEAVQAMERMFSGLLDVSKLDAGAVTAQPRRFAAQELLQRLQDSYAPLAADKALRFRVRSSPLWLETDPLLLERIVGNFVTNALRYTRRGGVLVACRRRGAGAQVVVVDTGVGIPEGHREIIFEEFVRLGHAAGDERGLGLGLSIVQRTAALLGLAVTVRSRVGHGSVFAIEVPCTAAQSLPQLNGTAASHRLEGAFVLVVDNDGDNRDATAEALRRAGCLVLAAPSAEAALDEVAQHLRPLDLIVTDLRLGAGMDGASLIRLLGEQAGAAIPALLVTAEVQVPDELAGQVPVLRKPVGLGALIQAASSALSAAGP